MRIISGEKRGRKLQCPRGSRTRPTSDLVREAIFNILGPTVHGRLVYDLFAGTGALGLEALSRGALRAVFVESDRTAVEALRSNVAHLCFEDLATVLPFDVYRWARSFEPLDPTECLVFIDPPYRELENHPARVEALLGRLTSSLPVGSMVIVESRQSLDPSWLPATSQPDERRYGDTHVTVFEVPTRDVTHDSDCA
jgi:16S rRNA (guanine966-N2)-methyltransferase